jgi:GAF domain-containing protein/PilZ domain-containing protein
MAPERRHCLRQKVNTPAFASFDGVTGGMILDLSEEGMAMQTIAPLESHSRVPLHISLGEPTAYLETTGYVAWADALGRAGVRFSDLPDEARTRLREWLTQNAATKSWKAPRWVVRDSAFGGASLKNQTAGVALSLETESGVSQAIAGPRPSAMSTTVQYEFKSLGGDLNAALTLIASRACSITRGTGAAVALTGEGGMTCRAVAGRNMPKIGSEVDIASGFTGECLRQLRPLRCDDAADDSRTNAEACSSLEIRSVLGAPIIYERDLVGLLEVFSTSPYAFDDGDLAVVERLAQTVVLTLSRAEAFRQE